MRQRVLRLSLLAGGLVVAFLVLLATCAGDGRKDGADGVDAKAGAGSGRPAGTAAPDRLTVPDAYDTARGWEVGTSPEYALAGVGASTRLARLERVGGLRFRLRTLDPATGAAGWDGAPWRPLSAPGRFPRLLSVTGGGRDGRAYFVTWSYGRLDAAEGPAAPSDALVSLDVYDAATGDRRRVELPWPEAPVVTAAGPVILVSDGKATAAAVDPATGEVAGVGPGGLRVPKGCPGCGRLTEVRAMTDRGPLVGGAAGFWVRGGWFSRTVAPKGAAPDSGVLSSVARGRVVARWQIAKSVRKGAGGTAGAATHELWAVHDLTTGRPLAQVRCRRPAVPPGEEPRPALSPGGRYLVAGRLAFDLDTGTGHCFEEPDGTGPLTLTTVADDGTAYGAARARSYDDALTGGGSPAQVALTDERLRAVALAPAVRLPVGVAPGVGLFTWTDAKDRPRLTGYPYRP